MRQPAEMPSDDGLPADLLLVATRPVASPVRRGANAGPMCTPSAPSPTTRALPEVVQRPWVPLTMNGVAQAPNCSSASDFLYTQMVDPRCSFEPVSVVSFMLS